MVLKNCSNKPRPAIATLCVFAVAVLACTPVRREAPSERPPPIKPPVESPGTAEDENARKVAAAELIRRGRDLLKQGESAAALRVQGQAVNLDPKAGEIYFYISEAWILEQNLYQARQYNRLAGDYLAEDPRWTMRLARQSDRIEELRQ
jgi:hypothetical protein